MRSFTCPGHTNWICVRMCSACTFSFELPLWCLIVNNSCALRCRIISMITIPCFVWSSTHTKHCKFCKILCFGSPLVQVLSRQFRGCPADSLWPVYPLYRHWAALCLILLQRLHLIDSLLWYFAVGMLTFSVFLFHRQALMDCQLLDSIIPRYIWHTL